MTRPLKQIHLAAHFPGVNNTTVWTVPPASPTTTPDGGAARHGNFGSQIDFSSFRHLARTAERGRFDFLFLAEGLRLRERKGRIHDLDVVGRPESLTVLGALAAVTDHLGLAATVNTTFNEPYELARRFASLDHLSGGRAAWNVVTTSNAFTGANFRRGGYLDHADRYTRAAEFVEVARALWDSWPPGDTPRAVHHTGSHFDITAYATVPHSPQVHPVLIQAGDSEEGREFAAATADIVFSRHSTLEAGRAFHADVKRRLSRYGRKRDELKIMPRPPSSSATPSRRLRNAQHTSADSRSARRPPSPTWRTYGAATCPRTTRTGRCRTSIPYPTATSCRAGPTPATGSASRRSGAPWPRRRNSPSANSSSNSPDASPSSAPHPPSPRRSTNTSRPTPPTASSWYPTSPPAGSTTSSTASSRSSRNAASSAPNTPAPPSATTWACPYRAAGPRRQEVGGEVLLYHPATRDGRPQLHRHVRR